MMQKAKAPKANATNGSIRAFGIERVLMELTRQFALYSDSGWIIILKV